MHAYNLILTLSGGLAAALLLGFLTQRLGLSPIVGYLLAGTLVGPHTPGFVADSALAEQLAEIGVILLMFGVGLQFHIEELLAVRRVAVPGAVAQSAVATVLGAVLARAFGWDWPAGVIFGMALAVASTVVLVRVLADNNDLHTPIGRDLGILTVEATNVLVATSIVSIVVNPVAYRSIGSIERWLADRPRLWALLNRESAVAPGLKTSSTPRTTDPSYRAVVIGYGPDGSHGCAIVTRQRRRPHRGRAEHGRGPRVAAGRHRRHLRGCDAS